MSIIVQQDATIYSLFISATALHVSGGISTHLQEFITLYLQYLTLMKPLQVAVTVSIMPDTVDTVLWTPDGRWRCHPKHVERFADINKLYIVASCWTIIDTLHDARNSEHKSYVYWTAHHLDSWIKIDQLMSLVLFFAQHVSNASTFIFKSLRLCVGVLLWFGVCWSYGVVRLGWCGILMQAEALECWRLACS